MFPSPNQGSDSENIHSVILEGKLLLSKMNSRCHGAKESLSTLLSTNKSLTHRIAVLQQDSYFKQLLQDARQILQYTGNMIQKKRQKLDVTIAEADLPFHFSGYAQGNVRNSIIRILTKSGFSTAAIILASTWKQYS
jgi:hypothetical protein